MAFTQLNFFSYWFFGTYRDLFIKMDSSKYFWCVRLEDDVRRSVYGQPFVSSALIPVLKHHYSKSHEPQKALALSFHGSPGTGKNYVTELIAKNIFREGYDSRFFHFFSGISDFPRIADTAFYQERLSKQIEESINICEFSMFVFDETDKIPEGILEVVKTYLDKGKRKKGVDFRKALYIFLSNIGESHIIDKNLALWKDHVPRAQFKLKEFQNILFAASFNEKGGLKYSSTVRSALINLYLPFLPLEKAHVKKCIIAEANRQNHTADDAFIGKVIDELEFGPLPENIFASHGCKQVETKVVLQIALEDENSNFRLFDEL
ncbi:torsin-1A-like isoform X2 [Rhodnius prolixus]